MNAVTKQLKREQLLDHGVTLLMGQGYHGTGLKTLLETVQIPKGSFYHYFASKEAFSAEVITHYIEPFLVKLAEHLRKPDVDALSGLNAYFAELIHTVDQGDYTGGCLLGNLMGEIGDTSEVCRAALKLAMQRYRDLVASGLAQAQQDGTVRSDKRAMDMADLLINTWQGALLRMKIDRSVEPLQACCDSLLNDYFRP